MLGVVAVSLLIREAGWSQVKETLKRTAPFLPLIIGFELVWAVFDVLALRSLYGTARHEVPTFAWIKSSLIAYAVMIILPAGRAGGEVARASVLSRYAGGKALAYSAQLQAVVLLGNAIISLVCWTAVVQETGLGHALSLFLLGNGAVTAVVGTSILLVAKHSKLGERLARRFSALRVIGREADAAVAPGPLIPWRAIGLIGFGRVIQTAQYGLILFAVGGALSFSSALITQGIHLVGAGLGDFVPNAVGITEGAYRFFAGALGLADDPARAISIALVARLCQFSVGGTSLVVYQLLGKR